MQKRAIGNQMLVGNFHCLLELVAPDKRRRDGDNYFKCPLDFATRMSLIKDDSYCMKGTFVWVTTPLLPQCGCRLSLWEAE